MISSLLAGMVAVFSVSAPDAKDVRFAGDLFGWDRPAKMTRAGSLWKLQADLPSDARIEYKFVVDGKWMLDPANPQHMDNGVGGENSAWQGPDYKSTNLDREPKQPMMERTLAIGSRTVRTFLPPGDQQNLAIIIYGDGGGYEKRIKAQNIYKNLLDTGRVRPAVLVFVEPIDRMKEYWKESMDYERFVVGPLLDSIRKAVPASQLASEVFVGGASLGGFIALKLAEKYPDRIAGGVQSQSGSFQVEPAVASPAELSKLANNAKLYLDLGTYERELAEANNDLKSVLNSRHRPFGSKTTHEGHTWTAWRNRFADGLLYLIPARR